MSNATPSRSPLLTVDAGGLAWITFADPERRMNVLDEGVMLRLRECVAEVARRDEIRAVVIGSGKPESFIAGADIEAIAHLESPDDAEAKSRLGQQIYRDLEALAIPTVCAVHGVCLGGGMELALACRFRVASEHPATAFGLPEVQLGLLPGWGGTTRLPRLVGLQAGLDLLLTGRQISASRARRIGLVSETFPPEGFRDAVRTFALGAKDAPEGASRRSPSLRDRLLEGNPVGRALVFRTARAKVMKETRGHYPAPLRILEVLQESFPGPIEAAFEREAHAFAELSATPVHAHLLHLFKLSEGAKKLPQITAPPRTIERLGVVGAGVMGGGIAQLAAARDLEVRMRDIRDEAVTSGLAHARALFEKRVKRGRMTRAGMTRAMERIVGGLDLHLLAGTDLVVEAVVERLDVKKSVLAEVEGVVREDTILATNTSSLSVEEMSAALRHPERFCGLHFFNPVHRMPLVEIVRGSQSSDTTLATAHALVRQLGKVPVVCHDGPGFLVNRILGPYLNEAGHLLSEGVAIETIDRVAVDFGMPMGPVRLLDEVGIDIARHAGETLHAAFGERMAPAPVMRALDDSERLGRKNGAGFYRWKDGRAEGVDETVYAELEIEPDAEADTTEIRRRLVLVMVNEAARILEEGIVDSAGDVDLGMIMGAGFPPFRGGLMRFADDQHPRTILEQLRELAEAHGSRFTPAPTLLDAAEKNRRFHELFPGVSEA
ncbi:MAG: 3-hydroxyacyl-CoA dehydrogenase NAD-binding domain-containing protein [Longimicrobiales bacterium]|nr:3-hydroxyacyl-CoA dehydrogenase NAD-binding domain-containing protein [Longimicrobiales bacterium]